MSVEQKVALEHARALVERQPLTTDMMVMILRDLISIEEIRQVEETE